MILMLEYTAFIIISKFSIILVCQNICYFHMIWIKIWLILTRSCRKKEHSYPLIPETPNNYKQFDFTIPGMIQCLICALYITAVKTTITLLFISFYEIMLLGAISSYAMYWNKLINYIITTYS